ncbi:MAG: ribonuclease III [Candidatus Marinimicrobia bacterium]|nr:ribonuclease III [Candidatus Neomarinimicrobiota bacterium]
MSIRNLFRTVSPIEQRIGYVFRDKTLMEQALTHRSRSVNGEKSYERLEFLGDAVLALIVADILYQKYPEKSEGDLTQHRSAIVNGNSLARIGKKLQIDQAVLFEKGLNLRNQPTLHKLLASIVESLIGAIFLDRGMRPAREFIQRWIVPLENAENTVNHFNYKGRLFEYCQKNGRHLPVFKILKATGPDHARHYEIAVYVDNKRLGTGFGHQKRTAEQKAAREALSQLAPEQSSEGKQTKISSGDNKTAR